MFYHVHLLQHLCKLWQRWRGTELQSKAHTKTYASMTASPFAAIDTNDPIITFLLNARGVLDVDKIQLDSPTLRALKAAKVKLIVPLVNRGELIGIINVGARHSERDYSSEDKGLLTMLASQTAPALHYAQLAKEQQVIALEHQRVEQELRVAQLIQQTLLPKKVPQLDGWQLARYYAPARFVSGDFYDFLPLEDGRLGIFIGDVTGKGVPAALVMATTRSTLRSAALTSKSPSTILALTNALLHPDMPPKMYVTCLYAVLDPVTGVLRFANAGHVLPYRWSPGGGVAKLQATGMPLGLMAETTYEEYETVIAPGESVILYSDGLVEARNEQQDILGFPRLIEMLAERVDQSDVIGFLLEQLHTFTGNEWVPEDDITIVTLQRNGVQEHMLVQLAVHSEVGNEMLVMDLVATAVAPLDIEKRHLERLKTAVAEATMNAMEHGNHYDAEKCVYIDVKYSQQKLIISIKDQGGNIPLAQHEMPDIEVKLRGEQVSRGWGLFLMQHLVDKVQIFNEGNQRVCELTLWLERDTNGHV